MPLFLFLFLFLFPPNNSASIGSDPPRDRHVLESLSFSSSSTEISNYFSASAMCFSCVSGFSGFSVITCSSSDSRGPEPVNDGVESAERLREKQRRAKLSDRIASGEFTVQPSGYSSNDQLVQFS